MYVIPQLRGLTLVSHLELTLVMYALAVTAGFVVTNASWVRGSEGFPAACAAGLILTGLCAVLFCVSLGAATLVQIVERAHNG